MEIIINSKKYGDKIVYFDNEDYKKINYYHWWVWKNCNTFYAMAYVRINGKDTTIQMHRLIMDTPKGMDTDHIDGNGLNNCKSNLRVCSHAENQRNRSKNCNNTSGWKGVSFHKLYKKFISHIRVNGKQKHLGYFDTAIEAAREYNEAAIKYYGEFARLNEVLK